MGKIEQKARDFQTAPFRWQEKLFFYVGRLHIWPLSSIVLLYKKILWKLCDLWELFSGYFYIVSTGNIGIIRESEACLDWAKCNIKAKMGLILGKEKMNCFIIIYGCIKEKEICIIMLLTVHKRKIEFAELDLPLI